MKKLQLEIPVLLPEIPDEKDLCVERLILTLKTQKGIEDAHIKEAEPALLCIHYDPQIISLKKVQKLAKQSGADLTDRYRHLLMDVKGIRHQRHARSIEQSLVSVEGIIEASVSAGGVVQLEWDTQHITQKEVEIAIKKTGLKIVHQTAKEHEHKDGEKHDHEHGHSELLGENTELYFAIGGGFFWILGLIFSFIENAPDSLAMYLFICASILGGYFTFITAGKDVLKGKFEIDFLMLFAAVGAAALGNGEKAHCYFFCLV